MHFLQGDDSVFCNERFHFYNQRTSESYILFKQELVKLENFIGFPLQQFPARYSSRMLVRAQEYYDSKLSGFVQHRRLRGESNQEIVWFRFVCACALARGLVAYLTSISKVTAYLVPFSFRTAELSLSPPCKLNQMYKVYKVLLVQSPDSCPILVGLIRS